MVQHVVVRFPPHTHKHVLSSANHQPSERALTGCLTAPPPSTPLSPGPPPTLTRPSTPSNQTLHPPLPRPALCRSRQSADCCSLPEPSPLMSVQADAWLPVASTNSSLRFHTVCVSVCTWHHTYTAQEVGNILCPFSTAGYGSVRFGGR